MLVTVTLPPELELDACLKCPEEQALNSVVANWPAIEQDNTEIYICYWVVSRANTPGTSMPWKKIEKTNLWTQSLLGEDAQQWSILL
jgi:hypothetical protein